MQDKKRKIILVACGTSIATTAIVVDILQEEIVRERGFKNVEFQKSSAANLPSKIEYYKPDIIVSTTVVDPSWVKGIAFFSGLPFLTGQGVEKIIEAIVKELEK